MPPLLSQRAQTITLNYRLSLTDGTVLSQGDGVTLLLEEGELADFLLETLLNRAVGEEISAVFPAEAAFGRYDPLRYTWVEKKYFPPELALQEGQIIEFEHKRQAIAGKILKIQGNHLAIDLNHPLAGHDLQWYAKILSLSGAAA
jgi:FKBP-type peptidyl-prolyl cis-trans isomerase SlpA